VRPEVSPKSITSVTSGFELINLQSDLPVTGISHNSTEVRPGDIFVALPGLKKHGIEFTAQAISNGAVAIASDQAGLDNYSDQNVPVIRLANARADMAVLAARVYDNPQNQLTIVGVTGTNGKTSVTHMLQSVFTNFGYRVGVIGTIGTYIAGQHMPSVRTTPESTDLYATLAKMVQANVTHVFMEVSSHALDMHRVDGLLFDQAVFTNLSQDHLDYHGTMENYFAAKAKLFKTQFAKHAIICTDDQWGQKLASNCSVEFTTVGNSADWSISDLRLSVSNTAFRLTNNLTSYHCQIPMIGQFNATNAALTVAVAAQLGLAPDVVALELGKVNPVPGRSQLVTHNSPGTAIVDYAHTPEAVEKVLRTLRELCAGQLITVMGCGGDRDAKKRPLMGQIAAEISDVLIITDDNPRTENPATIRAQIIKEVNSLEVELIEIGDRAQAIKTALAMASQPDVIAVLGKGHEQGQEIAGKIFPFDDVEVIKAQAQNV
jgi:UDP-N-acetylmuramoyl-L-alanyl-D-glutamate--2,6-diaminopimelate ligase